MLPTPRRTWELYLAGYAQAFDDGLLAVYQVLAAKPGTRAAHAPTLTHTCEVD